ncbi:MAG: M23 family metallopeptidase [Rhodospirillales bacterium]|nr:M23 family metallopeptidase [Rhodospirillales bacterium]
MGSMRTDDHRSGMTLEFVAGKGLTETGLKPQFPKGYSCTEIASNFGSPTRYDGSKRPSFRMAGLHGGLDLSLSEGTPLLALASGFVIHKGTGGRAMGEYLWVHYPTESTGLKKHIYAKYQHLREPSDLEVGAVVKAGQVIAHSVATGTYGQHFGDTGYPHLHMTVVASPSGEFRIKGPRVLPKGARLFDPTAVYLSPGQFEKVWHDPTALSGTSVPVPARKKTDSDSMGYRLVWPVMCD